MTINKPGSVDQNPCYDCAGCYDYQTHRAEDLRAHKDRAWCESCWDYHKDGDEALPLWHELERFVPALQAECEKLRKDAERYRWIRLQVGVQLTGSQTYPASPYLLVSPPASESIAESTDSAIDAAMETQK